MATLARQGTESVAAPDRPGLLSQIGSWLRERRNRAQILSHLQVADDRELRDLNINRYDFDAIARGTYRR